MDVWVDPRPVVRALASALRWAPETMGLEWRSHDPIVADALALEPTVEGNPELEVVVARGEAVAAPWARLIGGAPPTLRGHHEYVAMARWALRLDWGSVGCRARKSDRLAPCRGGRDVTLPFEVSAGAGRQLTVRTDGRVHAVQLECGDRTILLSGAPDLADDVDAYLALHAGASAGRLLDGIVQFEMLASTAAGGAVGAERLIGAATLQTDSTEPWIVRAADGRFAASINLEGFRAETVAFCHVQTLGWSKPPPPPRGLVFHRDGRQTLLWTIYRGGELEWRAQMGDSTHDLDERR